MSELGHLFKRRRRRLHALPDPAVPATEPTTLDGLEVQLAGPREEPVAINQIAAACRHAEEGDFKGATVAISHALFIVLTDGPQGVAIEYYQREIGRVMGQAFEPDDDPAAA